MDTENPYGPHSSGCAKCAELIADKNKWFEEAARQATRADQALMRAEMAEAALRRFV